MRDTSIEQVLVEVSKLLSDSARGNELYNPESTLIKDLNTLIATTSGDMGSLSMFHKTINDLLSVVVRSAEMSKRGELQHCKQAMRQEGIFTPQMVYQIKEDLEAVSLMHTKFKKETNRLVEEGQIATCRNAKLRLENEDLLAEIECLKGKLAS